MHNAHKILLEKVSMDSREAIISNSCVATAGKRKFNVQAAALFEFQARELAPPNFKAGNTASQIERTLQHLRREMHEFQSQRQQQMWPEAAAESQFRLFRATREKVDYAGTPFDLVRFVWLTPEQ